MGKIKKIAKTILGFAFAMLCGAAIGVGGVMACERLFGADMSALALLAMLAFLAIGVYLHLILHEGGHLIFGLLTGYRPVSFRIGSLTFVCTQDGVKLKKFSIVGTAGQCLMAPSRMDSAQMPYVWYNLGGCLVNLSLSVLAAAGAAMSWRLHPYAALFCLAFAAAGLYLGLSNLIPLQVQGINNDGRNAFTLGQDALGRRAFWTQLEVNARLTQGMRYREMDESYFELPANADFSNSMIAAAAGMKLSRFLDMHRFEEAAQLGDALLSCEKLMGLLRMETSCERLYLALLRGEAAKIAQLDTPQLRKYIKASATMPARHRLNYALALYRGQAEDAQKHAALFEKTLKTYPILGEIEMEKVLFAHTGQVLGA